MLVREVGCPLASCGRTPTSAPEDQIDQQHFSFRLRLCGRRAWLARQWMLPRAAPESGTRGRISALPCLASPRESVRLLRFAASSDVHSHAARVQPLAGWQGRAGCSRRSSGGGGGGGDPLRVFTRQRTTALARSWRGARHHASPEGRKSAEAAEQRAGPLAARWCRRRRAADTDGHGRGTDPLNRWSASLPGNAPKTGVSSGWEL